MHSYQPVKKANDDVKSKPAPKSAIQANKSHNSSYLMQLQKTIGNRSVTQMIKSKLGSGNDNPSQPAIQRIEDSEITPKEKKKLKELFSSTLGFGSKLYMYNDDITFEYLYEAASDIEDFKRLVEKHEIAATKKMDAANEREAAAKLPPVSNTESAVSGSLSEVEKPVDKPQEEVSKPKKPKATKKFLETGFSFAPMKKQTITEQKPANNKLIQEWMGGKPSKASIEDKGMFIGEETVYIYATVSIPGASVEGYPQVTTYDIEIHYHPVPTSGNHLHVKARAGSDSGNIVGVGSWLIPGNATKLAQADKMWNEAYPGNLSKRPWQ